MATKTISVDLDAYERLVAARRTPDESFSRVIKRATWTDDAPTAARFLASLASAPLVDRDTLARLDEVQAADQPPAVRWPRG